METVRIRTPQSLLQLLPRLVGQPEPPSLVAVPFTAGRSGMPMVVDLPQGGDARALALTIRAGAAGSDAVVLVACLAHELGSAALPLHDELLALVDALDDVGLRTLELLALAPDAWGDYAQSDAARGPLAELDLLDDPAPGVPLSPSAPGVPQGSGGPVAHAVAAHLEQFETAAVYAAAAAPIEPLERAVAVAQSLGDGAAVEPGDEWGASRDVVHAVATAIALVSQPALRDLAIELAIDGVDAAAATLAAADDPDGAVADLAAQRFLGMGPAPDADRLHARIRGWTAIAEAAPLEARAPVLVIVGFLHFFVGRGRTAARCADLASAIDPHLSMAGLLRDIVDAKRAPDWVLRRANAGRDSR